MSKCIFKTFIICILFAVIFGIPVSAAETKSFSITVPRQVTAEVESYNSVKLTWKGSEGADFYQIFRASSQTGTYKKIEEISSTKLDRYTYSDNSLELGRQYTYKIRAGKRQGGSVTYSAYSSAKKVEAVLTVPVVKKAASVSYQTIRITWEKTEGADGYLIYRSESENDTYKLVKTIKRSTELAYTESSLKTGKEYYYKIRAYRGTGAKKYFSDYTQVYMIRPVPAAPKVTVKAYDYYKTRISWKAVTGADGYYIYRSNSSNGTYQLVKEISGDDKLCWINTGLKRNQTYYYKVASYRKVGMSIVKSSLSSAKSGSGKALYQGIDVSSNNGKIDWGQVKAAGVDFAILRIMQGGISSMKADSTFEYNYKEASDIGVKVGVYRYTYASNVQEAEKEAEMLLEILDGRHLDYPIVLDMEDQTQASLTTIERMDIIWKFKSVIEKGGYKFALYASYDWLNNKLNNMLLTGVDVWIARYTIAGSHNYAGGGNVTMWQYSSSGSINGINGKVDMNWCYKKY